MLEVKQIDVSYSSLRILTDISLNVKEGEFVTIIGSNGAGKSTLINTISGLLKPSLGSITFLGEDITECSPGEICDKGLVQVPEGRKIFPLLTTLENLELGAYLPRAREKIRESLKEVYQSYPILEERKRQIAGTLSGGELQQLALGRALMAKPRLIMLDEPTLGLAPKLVKTVLAGLKELNQEKGMTILLVSQEVYQSLRLSGRTYVLENGKIVLEGESEELLQDENIRKAYLGI